MSKISAVANPNVKGLYANAVEVDVVDSSDGFAIYRLGINAGMSRLLSVALTPEQERLDRAIQGSHIRLDRDGGKSILAIASSESEYGTLFSVDLTELLANTDEYTFDIVPLSNRNTKLALVGAAPGFTPKTEVLSSPKLAAEEEQCPEMSVRTYSDKSSYPCERRAEHKGKHQNLDGRNVHWRTKTEYSGTHHSAYGYLADCEECGSHLAFTKNELASQLCWDCWFWSLEIPLVDQSFIIDGNVYRRGAGFGGKRFYIKTVSGETITTSVFHRGAVPAHFRDRIADNAQFRLNKNGTWMEAA